MASSNTLIGIWSSGLWQDIGSPDSISALTISGYAVQTSTLGKLNNLIGTCFSGSGWLGTGLPFDVAPAYHNAELAIVEGLFRVGYYSQLATTMMGVSQATVGWTNLREGDSSISRANTAYLGKEYREMAKDAQLTLNYLANAYAADRGMICGAVDYLNPPNAGANAYGSPYGGASYGPGS